MFLISSLFKTGDESQDVKVIFGFALVHIIAFKILFFFIGKWLFYFNSFEANVCSIIWLHAINIFILYLFYYNDESILDLINWTNVLFDTRPLDELTGQPVEYSIIDSFAFSAIITFVQYIPFFIGQQIKSKKESEIWKM